MGKRITAQDGKIELIIADGASDIDIGADGTLVGNVNIGQRVGVDNNGNITVTDSSDVYSWTLEPQASWIELTASNPGASEYGFYFEVGGEVGQYDVAVAAPSQPPVVADGAFDARWNIWSQPNPFSYELANFGFNGSPDLEIYNGIRGGNMLFYTFNDAGTFKQITFDPDAESFRLEDGLSLFIEEQATANTTVGNFGQIWVQSGAPNTLVFTDDGGTDIVIGSATGTINATGTPVDNQVAVWASGTTLEGDANFTWSGTTLAIAGAGAQLLLPLENDAVTPTLAFGDGDTGFFESSDDVLDVSIAGVSRFQFQSADIRSTSAGGPIIFRAAATGTVPAYAFVNDGDTGLGKNADDQASIIAGGVEMIRAVETGTATTDQVIIAPGATLRGSTATPSLAFGDGDTGFYEASDDSLRFITGGTEKFNLGSVGLSAQATTGPFIYNENASATNPVYSFNSDGDTGLGLANPDELSLIAGGVELVRLVEATDDFVRIEANTFLRERSTVLADQANYGQLWVRDDAPNTLLYVDDAGNQFTANNVLEIEYSYSNLVAEADPGAGAIRFNNLTIGSITEVYINDSDNTGRNNTMMLSNLAVGDLITFRSAVDPADYIIASVSTAPTDNTTFWTVPITLIHTGTIFSDGDLMRLSVEWQSQAIAGSGNVSSTGTPVDNQIAVWTDATTIEGTTGLTYSGTALDVTGNINVNDANGPSIQNETASATNPTLIPNRSDVTTGLGSSAAGVISIVTGGIESKRLTAATVTTDTVNTIAAQDETFYDNSPTSEGTFAGGTGYAAAEVITLSDGSTVTVDAVSGGVVTQFTVTTASTTPFTLGATLTTVSSTGAGNDDFTLTPDTDNVTAAAEEIISIPVASGTTFGYRINIVGTESATGDTVFESIFGAIRNQGGTTAIVGSDVVDRTDDAGATTWVVAVAADDTTDALTVDVTGQVSKTIDWKVSVEILEV